MSKRVWLPTIRKLAPYDDVDADIFGRTFQTVGGEVYRIDGPSEHYPLLLVATRVCDGYLSYACRDEVRKYLID